MSSLNNKEDDNNSSSSSSFSSENQQIPIKTIARIFKELSFSSPETRITLTSLELSSEYIKLFINEAIIRANEERIDEGDTLLEIDGIDNVGNTTQSQTHTQTQTQYPDIDDEEVVDDIDVDDFNEDDYYDEISNTQRQFKKSTELDQKESTGSNQLDSRHLQKIAGVLTLDF